MSWFTQGPLFGSQSVRILPSGMLSVPFSSHPGPHPGLLWRNLLWNVNVRLAADTRISRPLPDLFRTVLILNWMTALGVLFEVAAVPFLPRRWTVSTVSRSRSTDSGTTCKYPDDNFSLLHPFRDRSASDSTFSCSRLAPHMSFLARCFLFEYHRVFFWSTAMSSSFCFDAVVLA